MQPQKEADMTTETQRQPVLFSYGETGITFSHRSNSGLMVNATEMARAFPGKRPAEWLRLPSTEAFVAELEAMGKSHRSVFIQTEVGVGTWLNEDLALEFARWLSPGFAIWCNGKIKELLTTGTASIQPQNEDDLIMLGYQAAVEKVKRLTATIEQQAPKVAYHDAVLNSDSVLTITIIAKELEMSAKKLNQTLHEKGVIYPANDTWVLYSKYQDKGFAKMKTFPYHDPYTGKDNTRTYLVWTEKGRQFIHTLLE